MYKRLINKFLTSFEIKRIPSTEKTIFLTFDDGPEEGITEFVIKELEKYGFHATFFCRGDNAEKNPDLLNLLLEKGHALGNHTFSHIHAFETSPNEYFEDVKHADSILQTYLFRPPHGSLTLRTWWKLRRWKIVFWSLNSKDSDLDKFDYEHALDNLNKNTHSGDVVLFHFCHRHEKETRRILPDYLNWLNQQGFKCKTIEFNNK